MADFDINVKVQSSIKIKKQWGNTVHHVAQ